MKKLTLKRLEKILIDCLKKNEPNARNITVIKNSLNIYEVICDIVYPDQIAEASGSVWSDETHELVTWNKGDNLKRPNKLNQHWISFWKVDGNFFFSIDGLAGRDFFYDSTGYGVINRGRAYEQIQAGVYEYNVRFEPHSNTCGVLEQACSI